MQLRQKRICTQLVPLYAGILLLLAACQPQMVEVTRVVTETETVTETELVEVTRIVEGETVVETVTETVTEDIQVETETVTEAEEVTVDDVEATGSERDGGQLPPPPQEQSKVVTGREQTAVLATTESPETRAEPVAATVVEPLTAGEIDDNDDWDAYLTYLANYSDNDIVPVDVRQRHEIVVQDTVGLPILDAELLIRANGLIVTVLRTHSDGTATFFPNAYLRQADAYEVTVAGAGASATVPLSENGRTTITLASNAPRPPAQLDIAILLDATASMRDEIAELKANIEQIATQVGALPSQPTIRLGLVAYRDQTDEYVTLPFDFTGNVTEFAVSLNRIEASGGGDYPEALTLALAETVQALSWRSTPAIRLVFLIADAPPHVDIASADNYTQSMEAAAERGIKIYPLASSGLDEQGEYIFRQLAQFTNGRFLFLTDPAGQPNTDSSVSVGDNSYTVAALDQLILNIIREELSHLAGS